MCASAFGGGKVKTPEVQKVDPAVNNVTSSDVSDDSGGETAEMKRKKRQQGFAATQLATLVSQAGNKSTLG